MKRYIEPQKSKRASRKSRKMSLTICHVYYCCSCPRYEDEWLTAVAVHINDE